MEPVFDHTSIPIAIIGMACRLPGADNLQQFWEFLTRGGSAVVELPHERLNQELYYDPRRGQRNKSYSKLGAIVSNRQFDRQACPISPQLERGVDNAHLLMCQAAAEACRHAGVDPFQLAGRNAGVYIGHAQGSDLAGDYIYGTCIEEAAQFLREVPGFQALPPAEQEAVIREVVDTVRQQMPQVAADSADATINMVAGTISKAFRLSGPFMAVNSACASSLQAVLLGARALQRGQVEMAIVGGASDCKSDSLVLFSQAQSMSSTGTRPFDADADGLICSEGYVALVLKTLPRALADGDPIQAVIRGLGMSTDGRGKSLWAPRKEGQVKAMERAYRHGLEVSTLQYVEAHATSTNLGDATELNALGEILSRSFPPGKRIPISSVKANIGHALEAAGISSLIKAVLCMQHRQFVPSINIRNPNPKIDWKNAPFYISERCEAWPAPGPGLPRRAAVNAFGIGGLNMHVVVEEFCPENRPALTAQYANAERDREAARNSRPDDSAVAIVGMACIFPGAADLKEFRELLASGRDPKGLPPAGRWRTDLSFEPGSRRAFKTPSILGGYITSFVYDWRAHKLPPKQIQQADPLQFMLLEAADQALKDSGYDQKEFDRTRVGVLVGTEFGGDFSTQLSIGLRLPHLERIMNASLARRGVAPAGAAQISSQFNQVLLKHWPALIDESGSFSTSTLASRITKTMNLMGGAAAIDSSAVSSAAVLATSVDLLLSGDCDMMICAGGQRNMNLAQFQTMSLAGILSTSDRPRAPFDAHADGRVPGEGVGVVLLKRLSTARRDGDKIHAIIRGIGAGHADSPAESLNLAMKRAFSSAQVDPADVAVLEMDGTGLPERDQEQLSAVVGVYGRSERRQPLLLSTATGQLGHLGGASGVASLIKASLEVESGQMPAAVGLETPLGIVKENARVLQAVTAPVPIRHASVDGRRFAAVSSLSKNLAYHIVLERGEKILPAPQVAAPVAMPQSRPAQSPPAPSLPAQAAVVPVVLPALAQPADCKIYRLGAPTSAELAAKLAHISAHPAAAFAAADNTCFTATDQVRLAVVATSAESMAGKLQLAAKHGANPAARLVLEQQGCFYRALPAERPRVAFLFPGQGSQYAGMLRELVRDVPAAAAKMNEIDAALRRRGLQTFAEMAWQNPAQLGTDVWVTQIVMLVADLIVHAALVDMGVEPDVISAHSYGEFAALTAAGVWDVEQVISAARARFEAIEATPTARGALMATTAPPPLIDRLTATMVSRAYISNYNAPDQTIVGGSIAALEELGALLGGQGFKAQMITVPCPFHTPLMQGAGELLRPTLDRLRMSPPRVPCLSSVTNRYVAEPQDIRTNLVDHLTTPVRYVDIVTRLAAEQPTVFIEVGPSQALTKLNRRIVSEDQVAGIIGSDNPKSPGREQLFQLKALLECLGVSGVAQRGPASVVAPLEPAQRAVLGSVTHFDATQTRLEKMRRKANEAVAGNSHGPSPKPPQPSEPLHAPQYSPARAETNGNGGVHAVTTIREPIASAYAEPTAAAPVAVAAVVSNYASSSTHTSTATLAPPVLRAAAPAAVTPAVPSTAPAELEKFLINFVVEQTGYPPEVVELDADLEADLGIDSIKKAQLFGELAEYFDVKPEEGMTLDQFPTLRHVMNFLAGAPVKSDLNAAAPVLVQNGAPPVAAAPVAPPPANVAPLAAPHVGLNGAGPAPAELEKFLINFVVEQTGYPPEVVELDADLEADLGIDSIKKAQLFGELAEYFDVKPEEGMTLDQFPTLRHVMNFLAGAPMKSGSAAAMPSQAPIYGGGTPVVAAPVVPAPVNVVPPAAPHVGLNGSGPAPAELEKFLINFVVEQTGYPPEVVELDADLEADLGIDSIKKAQLFGELAEYFDVKPQEGMTLDQFPTLRHVMNFLAGAPMKSGSTSATPAPAPINNGSAPVAASPVAPSPVNIAPSPIPHVGLNGAGPAPAELEKFLINFVVEQTGYPPEVVELDADLEADLGIDSIKKAQLFGELAEYFDVKPQEGMTLDQFPTLRHVLEFLAGADLKKNLTPSPVSFAQPLNEVVTGIHAPGEPTEFAPEAHYSAASVAIAEQPAIVADELPVMSLSGTPYEIGFAHGKQRQKDIRRILRQYADVSGPEFDELPNPPAAEVDLSQHFTPDEIDELQGIADAVKVSLSNIVAHNLALYSDLGTCSAHFAVTAARNPAGRMIHAASEEPPLSGALRDAAQPVLQLRHPRLGIPHALVSFLGVAGGMGGLNARGLAVTACQPRPAAESARGRGHAAVVSRLLAHAATIETAIDLLNHDSRGASWAVCLSHAATDRVCYVECDGQAVRVNETGGAAIADNQTQPIGTATPQRVGDGAALLSAFGAAGITPDEIEKYWSRGAAAGGSGHHGANSVAAPFGFVVDPQAGDVWLDAGQVQDRQTRLRRVRLRERLAQGEALASSPFCETVTAPSHDLHRADEELTQRFVLRMVPTPFKGALPELPQFAGPALIVGNNPAAAALAARLRAAGVVAREMDVTEDIDATVAEFERIWSEQPTPHLFLMTGRDEQRGEPTDATAWQRRWQRIAVVPYFLTQRWVQRAGEANLLDRCTLIAVTALGGDFGTAGANAAPECGALTGLVKSVYIEFQVMRGMKGLRTKAIDFLNDESPSTIAAEICRELASPEIDFEVSFIRGERLTPYATPQPAPLAEQSAVRPGGTWVITGGARGITAQSALVLGRRFGLRLHLIGASPLPSINPAWRDLSEEQTKVLKIDVMRQAAKAKAPLEEAWSRVRKDIEIDASMRMLAAAGISATYHACDVADETGLARVLEEIRRTSGPIEGIIHGAGIERSCAFERKKRESVMDTLNAKVAGAVNLMRLTWHDPVRHFIGFGSISGRLGSNGQTDYGLASDTLCKLTAWYRSRRPSVHSVGMHWHPWADVGMAAHAETAAMMKRSGGPQQMPAAEGLQHLVRELYSSARDREVLITDWDYYERYYGSADVPPAARRVNRLPSDPPSASPPADNHAPSGAAVADPSMSWDAPPERIASRHEMQMVVAPLSAGAAGSPLAGTALVLGDNAAARALREVLTAKGVHVELLPSSASIETAVATIDNLYAAGSLRYLFLLSGRDADQPSLLDRAGWQQRRATGVIVPFEAANHLFRLRIKARDTSPITVAAVTSLGGDFGLSGNVPLVEGGAIAGLIKSLHVEDTRRSPSEVRAKVIDAPADESPAAIVEAVLRELAADAPDVEVAWSRGVRRVMRSVERPVESFPRRGGPHGGTWVVTGGARGITAAVALELGKRYGLKLHLVGRSPAPRDDVPWRNCSPEQLSAIKAQIVRRAVSEGRSPEQDWDKVRLDIEIYDSLRAFAAAGVRVTYHACNLADWDRLAAVLAEIRQQDGPITGIVHGAGYGKSARFGTRRRDILDRTIHGKLDGAVGLMALTREDPVQYFIGFGSISGRYGGNGLADYAAGNDMLAKLCDWYRTERPACATCCFEWQTWDEVGMSTVGGDNVGTRGVLKMKFISPREGIDHLCRELEAGLPTNEVLITDGKFETTFYPFIAGSRTAESAHSDAQKSAISVDELPLVETVSRGENGASQVGVRLDPTADPFLLDHQLRGKPLLPAVVGIEIAAEAAAICGAQREVVAIRDIEMLDGLAFHTSRVAEAYVNCTPAGDNLLSCELASDFYNRAGKLLRKGRPYQRATVELGESRVPLDIPMPKPPTAWLPFTFIDDTPMRHGPTLRGVTATALSAQGGWGQLVALSVHKLGGARTGRHWFVPAPLLDAAYYICGIHAWAFGQPVVSLPKSLAQLRVGRMPRDNERCLANIRCRAIDAREATYDFTVFGDDQTVILDVIGHRIVMLQQ